MTPLSKNDCVERDEWLRRAERKENIRARHTEQEHRQESSNSTDNSTPKYSLGSIHRSVLRFFSHMTRRIEADQNASSCKIRQTPIPCWRSTCAIVSRHESFMSSAKSVGVCCADW